MLYKLVLTFEPVDEILKCDHSSESCWAVLSCGAVYYAAQGCFNVWVCGVKFLSVVVQMKATELSFAFLIFPNRKVFVVWQLCAFVLSGGKLFNLQLAPFALYLRSVKQTRNHYSELGHSKETEYLWASTCHEPFLVFVSLYSSYIVYDVITLLFRWRCLTIKSLHTLQRWSFTIIL